MIEDLRVPSHSSDCEGGRGPIYEDRSRLIFVDSRIPPV